MAKAGTSEARPNQSARDNNAWRLAQEMLEENKRFRKIGCSPTNNQRQSPQQQRPHE
jgi:hypothetical protein